ncbi:AbrB/MazE/SpoVT family DNA-binding domain-containing protein [Niallia sp. 03133]|uniref:AbrB/MazE/SpoVT family DNA-binding domain-containing protein n=1 Tax=Niallia sp. 03133 TaxID=3458060 RepID=UPI0040441472
MIRRKIYKNGQISIPKQLQRELKIKNGDLLYVYILNKSIIIQTSHDNKTLNQCYISGGRISIPMEIRRILSITPKTPLIIGITEDKLKIYIHVDKKK